jgi:cobalt transporter subunit CbtB
MHPTIATLNATRSRAWAIAERWPALGVLLFGLVVLYAVGFSNLPRAHGAAHDTRHASGFPCH